MLRTRVVQRLVGHPRAHRPVADHRDHVAVVGHASPCLQVPRHRHPQPGRDRGRAVRRAERVVLALRPPREARQAAALPQRADPVAPAGQDLVRVGLVPDVPDQPVPRRVEDLVQRHRQLHHPQRRRRDGPRSWTPRRSSPPAARPPAGASCSSEKLRRSDGDTHPVQQRGRGPRSGLRGNQRSVHRFTFRAGSVPPRDHIRRHLTPASRGSTACDTFVTMIAVLVNRAPRVFFISGVVGRVVRPAPTPSCMPPAAGGAVAVRHRSVISDCRSRI